MRGRQRRRLRLHMRRMRMLRRLIVRLLMLHRIGPWGLPLRSWLHRNLQLLLRRQRRSLRLLLLLLRLLLLRRLQQLRLVRLRRLLLKLLLPLRQRLRLHLHDA